MPYRKMISRPLFKLLHLAIILSILIPSNIYGDVCLAPPLKFAGNGNSADDGAPSRQFQELTRNVYLHTLIGKAVRDKISADELVDRIIQTQSSTNKLSGLELSSVRRSGDALYCLFNGRQGPVQLKYSLVRTDAVRDGAFRIDMGGGACLVIEEVSSGIDVSGRNGRVRRIRDPGQLLKEALSAGSRLRQAVIRYFLDTVYSSPQENLEKLINDNPLDLSSEESCYANILIAGSILRGTPAGATGARAALRDRAKDLLMSVSRDGKISKDARSKLEYFSRYFNEMPALYTTLGYYRKFVSDNPPYFIEALETALYKARVGFRAEGEGEDLIDALASSRDSLYALVEIALNSAVNGIGMTRADIDAAVPPDIAGKLARHDDGRINRAVKTVAKYYEEERSRIMPDIVFRADAGMAFSYKGVPYVFLSNFLSEETLGFRSNEVAYNREWFRQHKFKTSEVPGGYPFEGSSEIQYVRRDGKAVIIMNQGPRTSPEAVDWIEESFRKIVREPHGRIEMMRTSTVNDELAHLSTCLVAIPVIEDGRPARETVMYYPAAFGEAVRKEIAAKFPDALVISEQDARNFAAESIVLGDRIIIDHRISADLEKELVSRGLRVIKIDLSEFTASGGGARSLVLPINNDLFDMSLAKNNRFQIADSVQGVFGVHYVTNPWMRGAVGMTNEKKAEAQRAQLFMAMHDNGAVMVPFETRQFSKPFDFPVLSETVHDFIGGASVQEEFKKTLPELMEKLGGIIGLGYILGDFPDGSFSMDVLEETLAGKLSQEEIKGLGGVRYLQTFFKRFFMAYQEKYANPSAFSFSALEHAVSLARRQGVIAEELILPEDIWPSIESCAHFEQFMERILDQEADELDTAELAPGSGVAIGAETMLKLKQRMSVRDNARESFGKFSGFLDSRQDRPEAGKLIEMYLTVNEAKDADLAGASEAALRCFSSFDLGSLHNQFLAWQERKKDAPAYLFFVFYEIFGRLGVDTVKFVQESILEKPKGTFSTSTEVHHRVINAFANIAVNHAGTRAAEAVHNIFRMGKDFKGGDQLRMAENIAQLSEILSFHAVSGAGPEAGEGLLADICGAKRYEDFSALLARRNREAAFEHIGVDYSNFSPEEYAHYQSIKQDLDELFSALVINKNFRGHPLRLLIVKLVYVATIKGDFARIKYDPSYTPGYLETFFTPRETEQLKVFLGTRKNSRGYRVFSSLERKGILKFWREDNAMVKGRVPESLDNFIYSAVKDYIERSIEFAPQLRIEMANLPPSREARGKRAGYLNNLGRILYRIEHGTGGIEDLKPVDMAVFDRIVSLPDRESQMSAVKDIYSTVSREQKVLVMANFRDEALDPEKGVARTLKGYGDTIAAAAAVIRGHPRIAALGDRVRAGILPDVDDIASVVNFDPDRLRPYEKIIDDPAVWKEAVRMLEAVKALKSYLASLAKKCDAQVANAQAVGELPLSYYYRNLAEKIGSINAESAGSVEIGNSGDPMIIMKALRGECYDYRDGLNSDVLISMFFNPFIKVGYVRKTSDPDSFLANQVFILSEVACESSRRVPVVTADFFYGAREYEQELADMMLFYKCTPSGIELNIPIEHEEAAGVSGQISVVQNIIFRDEAWDVFLDITNRMPVARMSDFERLEKTVLQPPFTPAESMEYVEQNRTAQAFYYEHIAPRDNFQDIYTRVLSDIVKIPSGTGNPSGVNMVADYMSARLKDHGFSVDRISAKEGGVGDHIVFRRTPDPALPTVLLSGHMDTVYTSASAPAYAQIRQGKIFGPGVMDMKGGLVVMLAVIKKLEEEGLIDDVNIVGVLNSDEERGSKTSRKVIEDLAGSYPTGLALVFEFNKRGEVILSRQGIGHFSRSFKDAQAAERFSGIVRNLCLLTDDKTGDRVSAGKIRVIDPRPAPVGSRHVARFDVNVTSAAGHAGARKHAGNKDSNFETASKMDAVEDLISSVYSGKARVYHRFVKGGQEVNQLSTSARWVFDIYADPSLDEAASKKLKADIENAARASYTKETSTAITERQYSEERIWDDPSISWGDPEAAVSVNGEYRFATEGRDAGLKLNISEFLGQAPNQPHRPVMREHQLAKNILSMIGYTGRGEFNMSAADSNFISNMTNSRGELIPTFDGLGLTGDGAHSSEQMDEWALLSSLGERTDLALSLIKQLLTITAHGEGMSLNSVRKVGIYKDEELAILSMTKDYAGRNKDAVFGLQSWNYDMFEIDSDALIAESWPAGTAGSASGASFPAKWDNSYAVIGESGEVVAALLAYEHAAGSGTGSADSLRIQYMLIDPRYEGRGIEKDLIIEAARALKERGGYKTLPGRELVMTCVSGGLNADLLKSAGFTPLPEGNRRTSSVTEEIYSASVEKIIAPEDVSGKTEPLKAASQARGGPSASVSGEPEEAPAFTLTTEPVPMLARVLNSVKASARRQSPETADLFASAAREPDSGSAEPRAIAVFSDNFIMDNSIPPYEMYQMCRSHGIAFWIAVKNASERSKIEALGFRDGVRFIELEKSGSQLASEYNLACAEETVSYMRGKAGVTGKIAVITNPFNIPDQSALRMKEQFGKVSARSRAAIIVPQIPMAGGSVVYADMLVAYAVRVLNSQDGSSRPLVIMLPPVKNLNEYIMNMIERFNAERNVIFAA